jgi:hypothetical protein
MSSVSNDFNGLDQNDVEFSTKLKLGLDTVVSNAESDFSNISTSISLDKPTTGNILKSFDKEGFKSLENFQV